MTNEEMVEYYNQKLEDLKKEYQTKMQDNISGGCQSEVFQGVGESTLLEVQYQRQVRYLEAQRDQYTALSPGVEEFLKSKAPISKFDLDNGTATVDNSLNPWEGKAL